MQYAIETSRIVCILGWDRMWREKDKRETVLRV